MDQFVYPDLLQTFSGLSTFLCVYYYSRYIKKQQPSPLPISESLILGTLHTSKTNCQNYALHFIPFTKRVIGDKLGYLTTILVSIYMSRH